MENNQSQALYELLVTKDLEPELLDKSGKPVTDPTQAEMFSFDWKTENKNYGTVVILIGVDNDIQVFYGDNVGRAMEGDDKQDWYSFLQQLKSFATRNLLGFELNNISRLKYTMQGMAAIKEGLFEGYYGKKRTSYSTGPKNARLMIKHNRDLGEGEARFRAVESLFVETEDGERFKLPFKNLVGGHAMVRHVCEGGTPYDAFGQHICEIVNEMNTLARFIRAAKGKEFVGETSSLVTNAVRHYQDLKAKAKRIISHRGYHAELESWDPAAFSDSEFTTEEVRDLFIERSIDHRIEEALPILARLAADYKEEKMKEANEFESWADQVMEGTWALPDTPEADAKLKELMSKPLVVGADATNATEQLYDLVGDDILFDRLADLADRDANANCWDDEEVVNRLGELGVDISTFASGDEENIDIDINKHGIDPEGDYGQDDEKVNEDEDHSPVASAITRRIIAQRLDLLQKYGPAAVTQAIDDVADFVGDVDEIGSSDVSGWIKQVEQSLGGVDEGFGDTVKKVGGAIAQGTSKAFDKLGGGTDQELLDKLRKDAGLPPRMAVPNKKDVEEDLDTDGVMMTKASNMSS